MTDIKKDIQEKKAELEKGVERRRAKRIFTPAVDIIEKKDYILLFAEMPGVDESTVDIILDKNALTIHGNVERETHKGHRLVISEYGTGNYERTFTVSNEIDTANIAASVKDGVLRLKLPKAAVAGTRKIPITGNA